MVDGGESETSVLSLLRVVLEHPEAQTRERGRDVVRRAGDGVDKAVGVVADVIRESVGVREHHRVLHHFRVFAMKRADCRHLCRGQVMTGKPENLLHFLSPVFVLVACSREREIGACSAPRLLDMSSELDT